MSAIVETAKLNGLAKPGDYCELLDENDERGLVVFRRQSGEPFMYMNRDDYDSLRALLCEAEAALRDAHSSIEAMCHEDGPECLARIGAALSRIAAAKEGGK